MKAHLRPLLLLLMAGFGLAAQAQSLIFYENTRSEAYLVKLNGGGSSQAVTNHIIEKLAAGNNKPASRTEFILTADENIRLTKVNTYQYDVNVNLGNFRLSGDVNYRAFPMNDFLRPSGLKFTLERVNKAGQVIERFPFEEVQLNAEPTMIANFRGTDSSATFTDCSIRISDKQFIYGKVTKGNFDQRTIVIDDCYNAVPLLEALYSDYLSINPNDIDHLDVQSSNLNDLNARLNRIGSIDYPSVLNLAQNDPVGYVQRYQQNVLISQQLRSQIDQAKSELPNRYYQRGLSQLNLGKVLEANADFEKAVAISPFFAAAHLELAKLRYKEGELKIASDKLNYIVRKCQPDPTINQGVSQLGNTIYLNHLGNANYANKQKRYDEALYSLDEASQLCRNLPIQCGNDFEKENSIAHNGIYSAMLDSARLALRNGQLEKAEGFAVSAIQYQMSNVAYIPLPDAAVAIERDAQNRIYQRFLIQANALAQQGKLREAEVEAKNALAYQENHSANLPDPSAAKSALNGIMDLRYKEIIKQGDAQFAAKDYANARTSFDDASEIEGKFQVQKDANLGIKIIENAKALAHSLVPNGLHWAKTNRLVEARAVFAEFKALVEKYSIGEDPGIAAAGEELRAAIFSQECANAQGEFDAALIEAQNNVKLQRFIDADNAINKSFQVAAQSSQCEIDASVPKALKEEIAQAVKYQKLLLASKEAIDRAEYKAAIENYETAAVIFEQNGLEAKFSLKHLPLVDYIYGSGRNAFVRYGSDYLTAKGELDSGLRLLQKAAQMGVRKAELKPIMLRLGLALADRDAKLGLNGDPKAIGLGYSQGNKVLKKLYKTYYKQRKRLM